MYILHLNYSSNIQCIMKQNIAHSSSFNKVLFLNTELDVEQNIAKYLYIIPFRILHLLYV